MGDNLIGAARSANPILIPILLVALVTAAFIGAVGILGQRDALQDVAQQQQAQTERDTADTAAGRERLRQALDAVERSLVEQVDRLDAVEQRRTQAILHELFHIRQQLGDDTARQAFTPEIDPANGTSPRPPPAEPTPRGNPAPRGPGPERDPSPTPAPPSPRPPRPPAPPPDDRCPGVKLLICFNPGGLL